MLHLKASQCINPNNRPSWKSSTIQCQLRKLKLLLERCWFCNAIESSRASLDLELMLFYQLVGIFLNNLSVWKLWTLKLEYFVCQLRSVAWKSPDLFFWSHDKRQKQPKWYCQDLFKGHWSEAKGSHFLCNQQILCKASSILASYGRILGSNFLSWDQGIVTNL